MKRPSVLVGVIVVAVLGVQMAAQSRPNFGGRWVQVSPADGAGSEQVIKHEGDKLSASHDSEGGGHVLEYTLDGSETRQALTSHGREIVSKVRAAWEKDRLVITTATDYGDGQTRLVKQVWSLDDAGRLVIVVTPTTAAAEPTSITVVYTKKPATP